MAEQIFGDDEMKAITSKENGISHQKKVTFKPYEADENFLFPPDKS